MKEYLDLVRNVLENGQVKKSRRGDTISHFAAHYQVDLSKGFPLLTTKEVNVNSMLRELLWYLSGDHHIRDLRKHTKIWDSWADGEGNLQSAYGRFWRQFPMDVSGVLEGEAMVGINGEYADYASKFVKTWPDGRRTFDQIGCVLESLRRDKSSRTLVVSAWYPPNAIASKLPPCHPFFVFNVQGDKLNCHLTQRSGDVALGIPFNLAAYSTLTQMVSQDVGLKSGFFSHTIVDAHVYISGEGMRTDGDLNTGCLDHRIGLMEQLKREPRELPKLQIANKPFDDLKFEDFKLEGYNPHPKIKFKINV